MPDTAETTEQVVSTEVAEEVTDAGTGAEQASGAEASAEGAGSQEGFGEGYEVSSGGAPVTSSAGGDVNVVNTTDIRNTAELGKGHMERIDEIVGEAQQEMAASEGTWIGMAGDWYRDVFLTSTNKYKKVLEEFGTAYTRELIAYADEYEGADSRAQAAAEEAAQTSV